MALKQFTSSILNIYCTKKLLAKHYAECENYTRIYTYYIHIHVFNNQNSS